MGEICVEISDGNDRIERAPGEDESMRGFAPLTRSVMRRVPRRHRRSSIKAIQLARQLQREQHQHGHTVHAGQMARAFNRSKSSGDESDDGEGGDQPEPEPGGVRRLAQRRSSPARARGRAPLPDWREANAPLLRHPWRRDGLSPRTGG